MNVFLTTLSTLPIHKDSDTKEKTISKAMAYWDSDKNKEPDLQYYMQQYAGFKYAEKNAGKFDKIIVICSEEVKRELEANIVNLLFGENVAETLNVFSAFRKTIMDNNWAYKLEDFVEVNLKQNQHQEPDAVLRELQKYDGAELYIDVSGGFRTANVINQAILSVANNELANFTIKKIIANDQTDNGKEKHYIYKDFKSEYDIFELVSGMNAFSNYGKTDLLNMYYNKNNRINNLTKKERKILDGMTWFDNAISLSNADGIFNAAQKLQEIMASYKNNAFNADNKLFTILFEISGKHFSDIINSKTDAMLLVKIIKWCAEKDYLQQALTLFESKTPKYLGKRFYNNENCTDWSKMIDDPYNEELIKEKILGLSELEQQKYPCPLFRQNELLEQLKVNPLISQNSDETGQHFFVEGLEDIATTYEQLKIKMVRNKKFILNLVCDDNEKNSNYYLLRTKKSVSINYRGESYGFNDDSSGNQENTRDKAKKCYMISFMENNKTKSHEEIQSQKMYLAVKIARNCINHGGSNNSADVKFAKAYFKNEFGIDINTSKDGIKNLLSNAIKEMELIFKEEADDN